MFTLQDVSYSMFSFTTQQYSVSLGILTCVRNHSAKHTIKELQLSPVGEGERDLNTDFSNQKVAVEKMGLLSSQGCMVTGQEVKPQLDRTLDNLW